MKEKKTEVATWGFKRASQLPPAKKVRLLSTEPCHRYIHFLWKWIALKYLSLPFTLFEPCGAVFIMNSKIHLRKNSTNEYFRTISHYLRVYSLSGFTVGRSINGQVFFFVACVQPPSPQKNRKGAPFRFFWGKGRLYTGYFFAAFAEVQVTVLSVLNLPRQGFPATCPVGHCCVCNPRLFASEIFCDLPTYNKQRMNKMSLSRWKCCLETQNARWRHVEWRL